MEPEGKQVGKFPPGARAETYLESVTSALIRASGVLRLPAAAILYVRNCPVAALCQEESGSSQILDSPSARAKDDCFVGLCLQVGPCDGRELPCGGFRDPEGGRSTHLPVCTAPGSSPSLRHCHQGVADQWPRRSATQTAEMYHTAPSHALQLRCPHWGGGHSFLPPRLL